MDQLRQLTGIHPGDVELEPLFDQGIGPVPALTVPAIHEQVEELSDMAGGLPNFRVENDPAVDSDDIRASLDEEFPPGILDIALELSAEWAEVPGIGQTTVDLTAGIDKPAPLGKGDQGIHTHRRCLLGTRHVTGLR